MHETARLELPGELRADFPNPLAISGEGTCLRPLDREVRSPRPRNVAIRGRIPASRDAALSRSDTLHFAIRDRWPPVADASLLDRDMATHPPRPSKPPIGHRSSHYPGHEPSIPELASFPCGHVDFGAGHRRLDRAIVSSHGTYWETSILDPLGSEAPISQAWIPVIEGIHSSDRRFERCHRGDRCRPTSLRCLWIEGIRTRPRAFDGRDRALDLRSTRGTAPVMHASYAGHRTHRSPRSKVPSPAIEAYKFDLANFNR